MATIAEQLAALAVLDTLHREPDENPPEAPWKEAEGWAAGSGGAGSITSVGWRTIAAFSSGANIAAIHDDTNTAKAEILHAKVRAHTASSGSERFASLYLNMWPAIVGTGSYAYRVRWVRTGTNTWTFTLTEWWGGGETVLAEVEGVTMADGEGGEVALRVDKGTQIVSVWVKSEEGAEWEEVASEEAQTELIGYTDEFPWSVGLDAAGNISRWENIGVGEGEEAEGEEPEAPEPALALPVPKITEPPTRLAISLLDPAGGVAARWGPDEAAVGDVPRGLGFSTSDPGGFKDATVALARRLDVEWPDLRLLRDIKIYGAGERSAWEGRLQEIPSHYSSDYSITPGAVGHIAELDDDPSFTEIYVSRDVNAWQGPSVQRRLGMLGASWNVFEAGVEPDPSTGIPSLRMPITDTWATLGMCESYFDGGPGVEIASLFWERTSVSNAGGTEPQAGFVFDIFSSPDDVQTGAEYLADQHTAAKDSDGPSTFTPTTARRWVGLRWYYPAGGGTAGIIWESIVRRLAVFGNHGLTKRGDAPNQGYYGDDVIADIVSRTAPRLRFTTGTNGSIQPASFVIPHLVFKEPGKGSDAILAVNAFHQRFFGVYENRQFFWLPTSTYRKRWRIRRSKGHGIDLLGPQAEDSVNGVVVKFTDPAGQTRVVGPPGCSSADETSALLEDDSPTNPVNAAGIPRKWGVLDLGFVTDIPGAIQVGYAWLRMKLESASARGSVSVTGCVEDDATGALYPAWYMRAGDSAIVTDGDNVERRIIETNYDHDSLTLIANMDSTPHKQEALMERMGVVLEGVI